MSGQELNHKRKRKPTMKASEGEGMEEATLDQNMAPDKPYILLLHLVSEAIQCTAKVGYTVNCCKTAEDTTAVAGNMALLSLPSGHVFLVQLFKEI
ncbi:hypothetical protein EMCRGX_G005197 [Ephydatia muelleri]